MKFVLDDAFIDTFSKKDPPFGFNGLGEIVYMRTYSRLKKDGTNEKWYETIRRVVEGTYTLQMEHIESLCLGWDPVQAQRSAQEMYTRMFEMKFLPPGRGLWAMGSDIITKKGLAAALNNCGFVSTKNMGISEQFSKPFAFLMDMCMLGVGIGFDTTGAGNFIVNKPVNKYVYSIEDTREGWVNSVRVLIDSYQGNSYPEFDYSHIREAGIPLKTFGGLSSGAQPLIDLHNSIIKVLDINIGTFVTVTTIVDIMNLIGKCVVSGNVRRCLPEGTLVHTEDGLVPIENIIPGMKAYTSSGLSEISELVEQGKQEVICVCTELGLFKCTEKHKIAVVSGINKYSWKCANELIEGDFLVFPDHVVEGIDITIYEDDVVAKIDKNFGWIVGYLNGFDYENLSNRIKIVIGCAGLDGFYCNSDDLKLRKAYEDLNPELNSTVEKIMKYFYDGDLKIPTIILQSKPNIRRAYLNGLYENTTKFYNYQFSKQIQAVHASLGDPYSLNNVEDYYVLEKINKSDQLITPIKFNKLIRTGKICQTYDISVPTAKEFIAGEGLLVHNTAEIAFGDPKSEEFMDLKDYSKNPDRMAYGWTSNNSIFAELGMDYSDVAKRICINGEPGLAWLDNMRKYSRMTDPPDNKDYRVCGGNPCLEQSLEHQELCCVTADTRIQTRTGSPKIKDIINTSVEVWNGDSWSNVVPFLAAKDKDIYRVTLSDGSILDCTDNHKWSIKNKQNNYKEIETKDLIIGQKLELFDINKDFIGINDPYAFELGLFTGDGYIDQTRPMIAFYGMKLNLKPIISGIWWKEQIKEGYKDPLRRLNLKGILDLEICKELNDKSKGFPDYVFTLNKESILKFVAGYIETDGSLRKNETSHHYIIHGSEYKMRDLQILLRRININHATIRLASKAGTETNKGIRKQDLYSLCIPSHECKEIPTIIKKATLFASGESNNNAHEDSKRISNKSIQKIKKIEKLENKQDTYCFNEPEKHKGVFGNVITHQCLVESFPAKADSLDDYLRTLKFAYLYAKTVTLGMTHWPETNRVQLRNRRIGCSVSGVAQFLTNNNLNTLNQWLDSGYNEIKRWDTVYSEWLCIPKSIKMTSVKPSGTVSLLAGATPGMHYPESRFYIRRMRLANNSPLVEPLMEAGYKLEPAVGSERDTLVVEIPIDVGEGIRTVNDVSMWEQLALAANMQSWWADNQVSCTVTFNPKTEGHQIASALEYFQYQLKGISFLPKCDYGAFPQMPYEEISESTFNEINSGIKKLVIKSMSEDSVGEQYCDGEACLKK